MEDRLTKQKADEYMEHEGQIRGVGLKNYADFILAQDGEEALEKVIAVTERVGHPIDYEKLESMEFYPRGYQAITIAAIQEALDYDEETFYSLGSYEPKVSLIMKLFMKFFVSVKQVAKKAPDMWAKYYTVGDIEPAEINEKERRLVLQLKNFSCHPLQCHQTLRGYFGSVVKMVVGKPVTCREVRCIHKGDEHHEYLLEW